MNRFALYANRNPQPPVPGPTLGQVLIRVRAFGLNLRTLHPQGVLPVWSFRVSAAGLKAIVAGPLAAARNIEAIAALNIGLDYRQGKGNNIAPTWVGI